jgi:hypothetical protein
MMKQLLGLFLVSLFSCLSWGQNNPSGYLLDWIPQKESSKGLFAWLHSRLYPLVRTLVHYTSPDIARESRQLWRISVDGTGKCVLASDTGVHLPRWGIRDTSSFSSRPTRMATEGSTPMMTI